MSTEGGIWGRRALTGVEYPGVEKEMLDLMQAGSAAMKTFLCLHFYWAHCGLPVKWILHASPICMRNKKQALDRCMAFCGPFGEVEKTVTDHTNGFLHTCPFGCVKIAAPVVVDGVVVGTLFAGPLQRAGVKGLPSSGLVQLLSALALKLGQICSVRPMQEDARRRKVMGFITDHCEDPITPRDLSKIMCLSPSRMAHVLQELFKTSFTKLVREARLSAAARCLRDSDMSCAEIALRFRFFDQSHFTRCFTAYYSISPLKYRRNYRTRQAGRLATASL